MHSLARIALFVLVSLVVGGLILTTIFRLLKGKILNQAVCLQASLMELRPPQIIAAIQAAPLLMQTRAAKAYVGMQVRWHVTLEDAIPDGLMLMLMLQDPASLSPGTPFAWVNCAVHWGKYPELNGRVQHTPLWVTGQIKKIDGEQIFLKNVTLDFNTP